jgi:fructan beta-fructosidase
MEHKQKASTMSRSPFALAADRPRLHFAVPSGWLNDPNGLVYLDGEYHLFYQHHPHSTNWGPMHWGHAVSRDLTHWEHLPIALAPDELGRIFSGSAVVDHANTAGFGTRTLVAIFTHDDQRRQVQSLAYSTDQGRTWSKYAANPVLAPADAPADFRDPRVFWYDNPNGGHWVMALACDQEVWFYTSPDLKRWSKASVFGAEYGAHGGVWECPELFSLPVDGGSEWRWVLVVGVQKGAPAGGSGTQYFVGAFDGARFSSDDPPGTVRWADYGADFYAAQAWQNAPHGRTLWLAWMSNWDYARETPASTWRGMMTVPRELTLTSDKGRVRLVQRLAPQLMADWPAPRVFSNLLIPADVRTLDTVRSETLMLEATFQLEGTTAMRFGIRVCGGSDAPVSIGYDRVREELYVEGGDAWRTADSTAAQVVPMSLRDGLLQLQILVDTASVEVFADDGRVVLTNQVFPASERVGVELFAEGGLASVVELKAWALDV